MDSSGAQAVLQTLARAATDQTSPPGQLIRTFHQAMASEGDGRASSSSSPFFTSEFHPRIDSQDAWVFQAPLPAALVQAADFHLGRPRCCC